MADDGRRRRSSPKRDNDPTVLIHDRLLASGAGLGFSGRNHLGERRTRGRARMTVRHRLGEIVGRGRDGGQHVERGGETGDMGVVPRMESWMLVVASWY
jgi:hypothetical protein